MILLLPIRTDSPIRRRPIVNHALIAANVLIYLVTHLLEKGWGGGFGDDFTRPYLLHPHDPAVYQFFTYQFLHANLSHLFGNMLFLWVFGNSVNAKMGHLSYLMFYLAAGVFAGLGFAASGQHPLLGASGAIAGVTTAFLVLFPRCEVTTFYWLWFYIGTLHVRALLLIGLKMILWDNILLPNLSGGGEFDQVAYSAHIAGYLFGFSLCFALLLVRALPRDQYDILALLKRFQQRQQFKAAVADPNARARAVYGRVARPVSVHLGRPIEAQPPMDEETIRMRSQIAETLSRGDYSTAADLYEKLVLRDPNQCLPRRNMLAVANQLMTLSRYPQAAAAYEKYLKAYPKSDDAMQIRFLLGIIYAKYLQQYEAAERFLRECTDHLTDTRQKRQADQWLETVSAALGRGPSAAGA